MTNSFFLYSSLLFGCTQLELPVSMLPVIKRFSSSGGFRASSLFSSLSALGRMEAKKMNRLGCFLACESRSPATDAGVSRTAVQTVITLYGNLGIETGRLIRNRVPPRCYCSTE